MKLSVFKGSPDYAYLIADSDLKIPELFIGNDLSLSGPSFQDLYSWVSFKV